jgi:arylformamidase
LGGRIPVTVFDISVPISSDLPNYSGDPPFQIELWESMAAGAIADVRSLAMGVHTGTHIDAPAHFIPGGATVDQLSLEDCTGPCQVVDLRDIESPLIERAQLEGLIEPGVTRLLLHTRNSTLWRKREFDASFTALGKSGAELLIERGTRLIGIDYLSIAPFDDPVTVHRLLLGAGIVILEGLNLAAVPAGRYSLTCLPIKLAGAEGAPARAILTG